MHYFNEKPIVDAKKPLTINVMRKDINKADQCNPQACAVAQSLKRIKGVKEVRVGSRIVLVEKSKEVTRYSLTPEESRKIRCFDNAGYFEPDTYLLTKPHIKLGARRGTKCSGSNIRKGKAKSVYNAPPLRHALRTKKVEVKNARRKKNDRSR